MKTLEFVQTLLCVSIMAIFTCCENNPNFLIRDPENTKSITLKNDASVQLQLGDFRITMDENNNFVSYNKSVAFACYDQIEYLIMIDSIIPSGWYETIAVLPGYGYAVRLGKNGNNGYARIIVQNYIEDKHGITGATIKYQYPWMPTNKETIVFSEPESQSIMDQNFKRL